MKKFIFRTLLLVPLVSIVFVACSVFEEPDKEEKQMQEDAEYNSTLVPGAGNLLVEESLIPNSESQLFAKLSFNGDTVAYYGSVDASGNVKSLHTTVYFENPSSMLVTEMYSDLKLERKYMVIDGVKSNLVEVKEFISDSEFIISIVDYDWETLDYETLHSNLVQDGQVVSEFSASARKMEEVCPEPESNDDVSKAIDDQIEYFGCWAQSGGGHLLNWGTALWLKIVGALPSKKNEVDQFTNLSERDAAAREATANQLSELRHSEESLGGDLKDLEKQHRKPKDETTTLPSMILNQYDTDLEYEEATDQYIKISYFVGSDNGNSEKLSRIVHVGAAVFQMDEEVRLMGQMKTPDSRGYVTFEFDPDAIPRNLDRVKIIGTPFPGVFPVKATVTLKFAFHPEVKTEQATSLRPTSAKLNGEITDDGNAPILERGFYYSKTNVDPGPGDSKVVVTGDESKFFADISNLEKNQRYYVRAFAENMKGVTYGFPISFVTPACDPQDILGAWRLQSYYNDQHSPTHYSASDYYWDLQIYEDGTMAVKASTEGTVTTLGYSFDGCTFSVGFFGCQQGFVLKEGVTEYTDGGCGGFHHHVFTKL